MPSTNMPNHRPASAAAYSLSVKPARQTTSTPPSIPCAPAHSIPMLPKREPCTQNSQVRNPSTNTPYSSVSTATAFTVTPISPASPTFATIPYPYPTSGREPPPTPPFFASPATTLNTVTGRHRFTQQSSSLNSPSSPESQPPYFRANPFSTPTPSHKSSPIPRNSSPRRAQATSNSHSKSSTLSTDSPIHPSHSIRSTFPLPSKQETHHVCSQRPH